jgi:hypothetical protein
MQCDGLRQGRGPMPVPQMDGKFVGINALLCLPNEDIQNTIFVKDLSE